MAKRVKKSLLITEVAKTNHIARVHAEVIVTLVLDAMDIARERGEEDDFSKSWIRKVIDEFSISFKVRNLTAFEPLLG